MALQYSGVASSSQDLVSLLLLLPLILSLILTVQASIFSIPILCTSQYLLNSHSLYKPVSSQFPFSEQASIFSILILCSSALLTLISELI